MNAVSRTRMVFLFVLMAAPANHLAAAELEGTWEKIADPPRDLAGREMPPGSDGAWIYVPEWKGFLLYGGCSPTLSNEGWLFDPDKRTWRILWRHDTLVRDKDETWKVRLPRDLSWSLDRPGPARAHGVARDSRTGLIYFFGGFPAFDHSRHSGPDPRLSRQAWLGDAKLGTWVLDPTTGQFRHLTDSGPTGITRGVFDPVLQAVVATPAHKGPHGEGNDKPGITWTYHLADGKWKAGIPDDGPRPFHYSGIAYDAKLKQSVCFNGHGETWTYDAGRERWTDMKPEKSPPARRHAAMCYDDARGVTILHGGVHHPRSGQEAFSIHKSHNGIHHADTWCYDGVRNEWTELKPASSPPRTSSARDLAAYDPDRRMVVFYDVAVGVWGFRFQGDDPPRATATLPAKVFQTESRPKPPLDEAARLWQNRLKSLPENTWLDLETPLPSQGCMNISFDPVNHCLVMLGGCGGAMFSGPDDSGYNNQVWLLDMQVGRFALRRNHHVWGPDNAEFKLTRLGPGCTRGNCFDATRNVIWTAGGNGWSGVGAYWLQSYDVASDRFSRAGPANPWGGGESGMFVHDAKNDQLVYLDGRRSGKTYLYDPKTAEYFDGGPCPPSIEETLSMFSARVFDSEIGVIAVVPSLRDWKVGDPPFKKGDISAAQVAMRTFAYDVTTQKWRDLAPTNEDRVPICGMPGIAYDSRHRAILLVKSDHGDIKPLDPKVPYGSLWVLDLAKNSWSELKAGPSAKLYMASMTYDPRLNLILCRFPHKGLWAYRWKGECPEDAFDR